MVERHQELYKHTKAFINRQIRVLNTPLVVNQEILDILAAQDDSNGPLVTPKQVEIALKKVNSQLTRHRRLNFMAQLVDQATNQVVKNETNRLMIINENLVKMSIVMLPLVVPEVSSRKSIEELVSIIADLPEVKSLEKMFSQALESLELGLAIELDENGEDSLEDDHIALVHDELMVVDDAYDHRAQILKNKRFSKLIEEKLRNKDLTDLLATYEDLRQSLIELSQRLKYNTQKLEFLKELRNSVLTTLSNPTMENAGYDIDSDEEEDVNVLDLQKNFMNTAGGTTGFANELERFKTLVDGLTRKK